MDSQKKKEKEKKKRVIYIFLSKKKRRKISGWFGVTSLQRACIPQPSIAKNHNMPYVKMNLANAFSPLSFFFRVRSVLCALPCVRFHKRSATLLEY